MKAKVRLEIGISNAYQEDEIEIPDEDLEGLTEDEKGKLLDEYWSDWSQNFIEGTINLLG